MGIKRQVFVAGCQIRSYFFSYHIDIAEPFFYFSSTSNCSYHHSCKSIPTVPVNPSGKNLYPAGGYAATDAGFGLKPGTERFFKSRRHAGIFIAGNPYLPQIK